MFAKLSKLQKIITASILFMVIFAYAFLTQHGEGPGTVDTSRLYLNDRFYYADDYNFPAGAVSDYTFLPEGFSFYGAATCRRLNAFGSVENGMFFAEKVRKADIYTSEDCPYAVYLFIPIEDNKYGGMYKRYRSSELMDNMCIFYDGRYYIFDNFGGASSAVDSLPETCEYVGTLNFVGKDVLPTEELETNRELDWHGMRLEGRNVYALADDTSCIYVTDFKEAQKYIKCLCSLDQ